MSRYFVQEVYGKRFSGVNPNDYDDDDDVDDDDDDDHDDDD